MMMILGMFVFQLRTIPYQSFQHEKSWRHVSNHRIGLAPALQFVGPDDENITLSGVLVPEITGGFLSSQAIEMMAKTGKAWPLIEGTGFIYGMFVIEKFNTTKTMFFKDGSARRVEFTLHLKRSDDSIRELFNSAIDQLSSLKDKVTDLLPGGLM